MTLFSAASSPLDSHPHVRYFVAAAFFCLAVTALPIVIRRSQLFARRCYWGGTAGAATCALVAGIPDWGAGLTIACGTVFAMVLGAYFTSGYITIGGKVYAFHNVRTTRMSNSAQSSIPPHELHDEYPDAYGTDVTATKAWWLLVAATGLCVFTAVTNVTDPDGRLWLVGSTIVILAMPIGFGYLSDGSWGYEIARKQYTQFVVVSVMTAGVFAVLYLPAYFLGRRWPIRSKRSLEYRLHPRFWGE